MRLTRARTMLKTHWFQISELLIACKGAALHCIACAADQDRKCRALLMKFKQLFPYNDVKNVIYWFPIPELLIARKGAQGGSKLKTRSAHIWISSSKLHCTACAAGQDGKFIALLTNMKVYFVRKGHLISKANFKLFISTKKPTKISLYFCPSFKKPLKSGRNKR